MKKNILWVAFLLLTTVSSFGQGPRTASSPPSSDPSGDFNQKLNWRQVAQVPIFGIRLKTIDKSALKESVELEKKKYVSYTYDLAKVDEYDTQSYVRYNIYDDQMEFVKDESIYYLVKEEGRVVKFLESKSTFRVHDFDGELGFFKVHVDKQHSLVAKLKVRYVDAKVAISGYDRDRPADYKRLKDELYLAINNKDLVKLSKKKKEFFKAFGDKADLVKSYAKENKLSHKTTEDISSMVAYFNTL